MFFVEQLAERKAAFSRHRVDRQTKRRHLAVELSETVKLSLPMALTQLAHMAMVTTDLAFIGRIGTEAVAAAALAGTVYFISLYFGMGMLAAVAPLAAQAFGADNLGVLRRSLRMGLWAALLLSLPIMALALHGEQMLLAAGQAPDAARRAQQYLFGLAWGAAPAVCFQAIRSFMGAVNRPGPVLWIALVAIPLNGLLVYLLISGKLGFPPLELFGAGLATALVNWATFLAGLWFVTMRRPFRAYYPLADFWQFDWALLQQLIFLGTPSSIAFLMESGLFPAAALLIGVIDANAIAAHQIAFQTAATLFMIPFGIGMAATVRVGHALGRNDYPGIRRAGLVAMFLGVMIAAMLALAVVAARFKIAELFLGKSAADADPTIELAAHLLLVAASSFIPAALHSIASGSLRGLNDTRVPLVFAAIGYWLIAASLCYVLGLKIGLGAIGVWIGLSIGTAVYAALLVLRFQLLTNRLAVQSQHLASIHGHRGRHS
ncbi:MATE family multidrug resistance protein [Bradyrhizobium sp. USDA 4461]